MGQPKRHCCQHTSACVWQWVGRSATAASTRPRSGMRQPIRGHSSQQGCLSGPTSVQLLLHRSSRSSATPTCSAAGLPQFSRSFTDQPRETPRVQSQAPTASSRAVTTVQPRLHRSTAQRHPVRPKTRAVPPGGTLLSQRHNRYRLAGPTSVQPKLHRSTCSDAPRCESAASPSKLPPFCRSLHYGSRLGVAVRIC